MYYLETVFAKFVPMGKCPVLYGFHGNQPNYLMYGSINILAVTFVLLKVGKWHLY